MNAISAPPVIVDHDGGAYLLSGPCPLSSGSLCGRSPSICAAQLPSLLGWRAAPMA